jgi:hypothetical protein
MDTQDSDETKEKLITEEERKQNENEGIRQPCHGAIDRLLLATLYRSSLSHHVPIDQPCQTGTSDETSSQASSSISTSTELNSLSATLRYAR